MLITQHMLKFSNTTILHSDFGVYLYNNMASFKMSEHVSYMGETVR